MNKEINRIDEKVKVQMEMLVSHTEKRANLIAEKRDGETRVTYLQDLDKRELFGQRLDEASLIVMQMTTEWNMLKKQMDESCSDSENPDPDKFSEAMEKMASIFPKKASELAAKVKMTRRWWKFESPLRNDLLNQIDFMRRVHKNAPKHLKRMKMSDKQRAAADAASLRMKMRWGGF